MCSVFCFVCVCTTTVDCMTQTVELNSLCMKLGMKPMYKPIDPYPGMRPSNFNYNIRAPGPYQRSMQQYVHLFFWGGIYGKTSINTPGVYWRPA